VKSTPGRGTRGQGGYTLVELIVASAIGLMVMTGLTSVVLTTWRAGTIATSRIEASGQIRNFEFDAYDDFALSSLPVPVGCAATVSNPCTTNAIVLQGDQASNSATPVISPYQVTYTWDGVGLVDRQVGTNPPLEVANHVSDFSWYLDGQTVVVRVTVKIESCGAPGNCAATYTETQTFRFYPRVNP
jgi:prepilin-type N-terminal cleavage/methylation domain-containing protein